MMPYLPLLVGLGGVAAATWQERRSGSRAGDLVHLRPSRSNLLSTHLRSAADAKRYLGHLHAMGLDYHPDESAGDVVSGRTDAPLFTKKEVVLADARMREVNRYLADPAAVLVALYGAP